MTAPLGLGLFISTLSRSAVNGVAVGVGTYLVLFLISEVHFFRDLRPYLFTSYMAYWRGLFRTSVDWPSVLRDASKLLAFACLFLTLAHYRFRVREEL